MSSFVALKRTWKTGDTIALTLPKTLRLEPLPDNPRRVAILWGPLVLAGDLGPEDGPHGTRSTTCRCSSPPSGPWPTGCKPVPDQPGAFRTAGVGKDREVEFVPFYRLHRRTYAIYWDLFTPPEWDQRAAEIAAEREQQRKLEAATVGYVQPGEMQAERDANMQGESTEPVRVRAGPAGAARSGFPSTCRWTRRIRWRWWSPTTTTSGRTARLRSWWTARASVSRPSSAAARCGSSTWNTPCPPRS